MAATTPFPTSRLAVLGAVLAVAATAACGGGDDLAVADLRGLVLQPADVPRGFVRFAEGRLGRAETAGDPERFGRRAGWRAGYKRPGSAATSGPLVVDSRVELFGGEAGARKELAARRGEFGRGAGGPATVPDLGEEAWVADTLLEAQPSDVRSYTVVWRQGPLTGSVVAQGFDGRLTVDEALALARVQHRRIEQATG